MATDEDKVIGEEAALERDIERVKKASKEESEDPKPKKPESQDDDDDEVEFEDDGDDGDIPNEPTRKEKKRARYREQQERAERAERAYEQAMANQQALMQQIIASQQQSREPAQPNKSFEDRYRDTEFELVDLRQEFSRRSMEYAQAQQNMPRDELARFIDRQREIEVRKQELLSERYIERNNLLPQQVDPRQQQAQMELAVLRAQYADVTQNQQAALYTDYAYKRLRAEGKPDTIETARLAFEEARKTVLKKTPSAPRPTEAQRSRYTGQPNGAAPARGGEEGGPKLIKMTKEMRRMADTAYPHIKDDKKRWKLWYESKEAAAMRSKMTGA